MGNPPRRIIAAAASLIGAQSEHGVHQRVDLHVGHDFVARHVGAGDAELDHTSRARGQILASGGPDERAIHQVGGRADEFPGQRTIAPAAVAMAHRAMRFEP